MFHWKNMIRMEKFRKKSGPHYPGAVAKRTVIFFITIFRSILLIHSLLTLNDLEQYPNATVGLPFNTFVGPII